MDLIEKVSRTLEVLRKINKYTEREKESFLDALDYWEGIDKLYNEFVEIDCPDLDIAFPSLTIQLNNPEQLEIFKTAFEKEAKTYMDWFMVHIGQIYECHDFKYKVEILTEKANILYNDKLAELSKIIDEMKEREKFYNAFLHEYKYFEKYERLHPFLKPPMEEFLDNHRIFAKIFNLKYHRTPEEQARADRYDKFYDDYLTFLYYFNPPYQDIEDILKGWNFYDTFTQEKYNKEAEYRALWGEKMNFIYGQAPILDTEVYWNLGIFLSNALQTSKISYVFSCPTMAALPEGERNLEEGKKRGAPKKPIYNNLEECFNDKEKYLEVCDLLKRELDIIQKEKDNVFSTKRKLDARDCKGLCLTLIGQKIVRNENVEKLATLILSEYPELFSVKNGGSVKNSQSPNMERWKTLL